MRISAALPLGVGALLFEAARRRRELESALAGRLAAAGFDEVILPILDYFEPYEPLLTPAGRSELYRFAGRDGELLALRADSTPMLARLLAPRLGALPLPLRLFYRGDVVRYQEAAPGRQREFYELGAELLGLAGEQAEHDMLELFLDLLGTSLDLPGTTAGAPAAGASPVTSGSASPHRSASAPATAAPATAASATAASTTAASAAAASTTAASATASQATAAPAAAAPVAGIPAAAAPSSGRPRVQVVLGFAGALDRLLLDSGAADPARLAAAVARRERGLVRREAPSLLAVVERGLPERPEDLGAAAADRLRRLLALAAELGGRFPDVELTVDLAEFARQTRDPLLAGLAAEGERPYYDGLVFRAHAGSAALPVGGGGRYDRLFARLGAEVPAVGFSLGLDRLLEAGATRGGGGET